VRIAIFHLGFFYSGGGEKLILEEIKGLRALGHEVDCFAPYINRKECYPDVPEMEQVQALFPSPPYWLPMKDALWLTLSCLLIPLTLMKFRSYDVLFGANQPGPWYTFVLSKLLRKPYVIYLAQPLRILHPRKVDKENGIRIREGDHRFLLILRKIAGAMINWADRISVTNAATVLTNGKYVNRWISEIYSVSNIECAAGCHPHLEKEINYQSRWQGRIHVNGAVVPKPYILLTNRHSPQKRFEYVLWALKRIKNEVPRLSLVITGQETKYTDQLRYLVNSLNLNGKVRFVGLVSENDLQRLYSGAALYVYPAPEEDFGMGIVEAMAAGTPVIAWNNAGPSEIVINNETGFLVNPYDTEEFARKISILASEPSLVERMGRAGYEYVKENFSYERHNKILSNALSEAVRKHSAYSKTQLFDSESKAHVYSQIKKTSTDKSSNIHIECTEYSEINER
jgi:glycosyltransferase involved in cell wall biosynthesis